MAIKGEKNLTDNLAEIVQAMANQNALAWARTFVPGPCEVLRSRIRFIPKFWENRSDQLFAKFQMTMGNIERMSEDAHDVEVVLSKVGWVALGMEKGKLDYFANQAPDVQENIRNEFESWHQEITGLPPKITTIGCPALYSDGRISWLVRVEKPTNPEFQYSIEILITPEGHFEVNPLPLPATKILYSGVPETVETAFVGTDLNIEGTDLEDLEDED